MIFVAVVPQSQCHSVSCPKNGGETHVFFMQVLLTGATVLGVEVEVGVGWVDFWGEDGVYSYP